MSDDEFRAFLDLLMCSDPWPVIDPDTREPDEGNQEMVESIAYTEAGRRGYDSWYEAFHCFHKEKK